MPAGQPAAPTEVEIMAKYKKCPRCELNYIEEDKDYCDVCLAEMQGGKLRFADLDDDEEEVEKTELCPVCGENYMRPGEKMCDECKQNADNYVEEDDIDPEKDEEWRNYLDEETDDLVLESDGIDIGEDFMDDFDEEMEDDYVEESESDDESVDDLDYDGNFDDLDDDEEEDEEEDEDDDF